MRRRAGVIIAVLCLGLGGLVAAASDADAQDMNGFDGPDGYALVDTFPLNEPCPQGDSFVAVNYQGDANLCIPSGYTPITTSGVCAETEGIWDPAWNLCSYDLNPVVPCANIGGDEVEYYYEIAPGYCGDPWFVIGYSPSLTPVCIEDSIVQTSPSAEGLTVGGRFYANGTNYLIATGAPTCSFGCHDGFDINCDDKLGDFCSVELNRRAVRDVRTCLAASVPAVPAAAAPQPVATTSLAHTGADSGVADLGVGLVAAGSLAYAVRERIRKRTT